MIVGLLMIVSHAFGADIIIKNKATIVGDFDIHIAPYISDKISIRVSNGMIAKNQILIGVKFRINENFSTSLNLFLQHQRKNDWKLDYGPLAKVDIKF
tara:strand:+ start:472 stop:765 length:294 start_codon:yes stop_codon:yes gene_type:complete